MIGMQILVVEDNQKLAGYIKKALEQKSYSVDVAYDGVSGEEKASFGEYDHNLGRYVTGERRYYRL